MAGNGNENVVFGILKSIENITLGERVRGFNEFIKACKFHA